MKELSYPERLKKLKLPSLEFRRERGDLIDVYKYVENIYDTDHPKLQLSASNRTRGHSKKLEKQRYRLDVRSSFFSNRVVNLWNDLPESVVNAKTVNSFKNQLDSHWKFKENKFNPTCYHTV